MMRDNGSYQNRVEYWRDHLVRTAEQYGNLQHPEVLRVSRILDQYVLHAQHQPGAQVEHVGYWSAQSIAAAGLGTQR